MQDTRIDRSGRRLSRSSFVPRVRAMTDAPVAGAVTLIPGISLQTIRVPVFTWGIVTVVAPGTLIAELVELCWTPEPLAGPTYTTPLDCFPTTAFFFAEPQPATARPRTASSGRKRIGLTSPGLSLRAARMST